jgi:hypothetical protein
MTSAQLLESLHSATFAEYVGFEGKLIPIDVEHVLWLADKLREALRRESQARLMATLPLPGEHR